ncbi:hypothetical protein BHM03_00030631 [Ensete ventricosum]|nr:hypothetical protein BHM03_00030631 [Ensete ventricosum]
MTYSTHYKSSCTSTGQGDRKIDHRTNLTVGGVTSGTYPTRPPCRSQRPTRAPPLQQPASGVGYEGSIRAPTPSRDDRWRASAQGLNQQTLSGYGGRPNPLAGTRFDTNTTAILRREASEKELHEVRSHLGDAQRLLKEARVRARKMDDRLLQAVKALESARAELPRQSVVQYKESLGFKEGLKRMGRVTYEYGYRVALARFHARHPDAEVEEDPFTIHPEDDLVSMERQQAFNDSVPPEP